jgi:SAM-dependent methyltransferase
MTTHDETRGGYDTELFRQLAELEPTSWWFRTRNDLIERTVRTHFSSAKRVLEVGCGTGYTMLALQRAVPEAELTGTELFEEGLTYARERLPDVRFEQLDAMTMDYRGAFDLICAFDVLEHIGDDEGVLRAFHRAIAPGGGVVVTVPQHPVLWSEADVYAHHERRYRRPQLVGRLRDAGFEVVRVTSFVTLLAPLMVASRLRERFGASFDPLGEFAIPRGLDRAFEKVARAEQRLLARGASLPFGGSLLAVAVRR